VRERRVSTRESVEGAIFEASHHGSVNALETQLSSAPVSALTLGFVEMLFDQIPHISFSVKDEALRYVGANRAMLDFCGARQPSELIGRTAREFFPDAVRQRYETADRLVMRTRRVVKDQLDLTLRLRGAPVWVLLGRWPVLGARQEVCGVVTLARALAAPDRRHPTYHRVAAAIESMKARFAAPLDIADLACSVGVSLSRLERDFMDVLGMSPRRYLMKIRLEAALELLLTDKAIVDVAYACGYADQSAFSRRFHAVVGVSPSEYRRAYAA